MTKSIKSPSFYSLVLESIFSLFSKFQKLATLKQFEILSKTTLIDSKNSQK